MFVLHLVFLNFYECIFGKTIEKLQQHSFIDFEVFHFSSYNEERRVHVTSNIIYVNNLQVKLYY